jgi:hypothetical protein
MTQKRIDSSRPVTEEHDRRMIAIASLFVGFLCDCFKPRQQLEAEILALRHQLNILQHRAHADCICVGLTAPCSFGSIAASRAFLTP